MPLGLPARPSIKLPANPLTKIVREGRETIEKMSGDIRSVAEEIRSLAPETSESPKEPPVSQNQIPLTTNVAKGTACLPCSRDHFITASAAISEGIRFAREKGVRDPEAVRRIRIALGELDIMERIDLAPEEMTKLKGAEKELANWTLMQSRDLRHAITAIKDVEAMEQAAATASQITEEFMGKLLSIPEECESCTQARESLKQFIEKRRGINHG